MLGLASRKFATTIAKGASAYVRPVAAFSVTRHVHIDPWKDMQMGPPDPILGLTQAFKADTFGGKINLGVGAYRDDAGKPYELPVVAEALKRLSTQSLDHEYAPITGDAEFVALSSKLAWGEDSALIANKQLVGCQSLSGTGALSLGAEFLRRFRPGAPIYVPNPTWANHIPIFKDHSLDLREYRYYNPANCGLDLAGALEDIKAAPEGSTILLHASAHNPTGVDPTFDDWKEFSQAIKSKNHVCFFDMAYQGFSSGDPEKDAQAIRMFADDGHSILLAQSFAKNFGLYGERVGCFSVVCKDADQAAIVDSQVKLIARPRYSNPPIHGARIVKTILSDDALTKQWRQEVQGMADRIISMRAALVESLTKQGSSRDWSHIEKQIGMFTYTGLSPEQCDTLKNDYHIYMTRNGRVSMAGVTTANVDALAAGMHAVTK
eukprot:GFYU01011821.1.p2 GENE.GFYU01011821.1~~GFYU01011821.1.p2  ORF type:complete len:453 (+),score=140.97 GFYU01011821.1:56-1360(+)